MALGIPVADVVEYYGPEPMNQQKLTAALTECGIYWNQCTNGNLVHSGLYFAVVPSLNIRGGMHQILIDYDSDRGCNGIRVFDPSSGQRYAADGSDLLSWSDLITFQPGGRLPSQWSETATRPGLFLKLDSDCDLSLVLRRQDTPPDWSGLFFGPIKPPAGVQKFLSIDLPQ